MEKSLTPDQLRLQIRRGGFRGTTSGLAAGFAQCNLADLAQSNAADFLRFCQQNPRPCPLIAVTAPGAPTLPGLGDIGLGTDLPGYRIFRHGNLAAL